MTKRRLSSGLKPLQRPVLAIGSGLGKIALAVVYLLVAGCASIPVGRYQALRAASEDVLTKTSETYTRIEKRQRDFAVLTVPNQSLTVNSFKPVTQDGKSYDITPELRYRENALRVLVNYTALIEAMAGKDYETSIDRATQELGASLAGITDNSDGKAAGDIMATVADAVGRGLTDRMRRNALINAMDRAQPALETLCNLISSSNKKIGAFTGMMRTRYVAHANASRPSYGSWTRYTFDLEVADVLEEIQQIEQALDAQTAALEKLPLAHREIRESLDHSERPLTALRGVIDEARRMQSFYKDLSKK